MNVDLATATVVVVIKYLSVWFNTMHLSEYSDFNFSSPGSEKLSFPVPKYKSTNFSICIYQEKMKSGHNHKMSFEMCPVC